MDGDVDNNDNEDNEDDEILWKKYSTKEGFIKKNLLKQLINIFDFSFLSLFKIDQEKLENE